MGLCEKICDSQAYHLVRQHFAVLEKAVRENNGAIVKTIGDAIMASFSNPLNGLTAVLRSIGILKYLMPISGGRR